MTQGRYYGQALKATIEDGRLIIAIGVQTLAPLRGGVWPRVLVLLVLLACDRYESCGEGCAYRCLPAWGV